MPSSGFHIPRSTLKQPSNIPRSDDDHSDLYHSTLTQQIPLPLSPSSSPPKVKSKSSSSNIRIQPSSPLRSSFTGKRTPITRRRDSAEDFEMDFEIPQPSSSARQPSARQSSMSTTDMSTTTGKVSRSLVGLGPSGLGTITRLGSSKSPLPLGTVRLRRKTDERAWEADFDFDTIEQRPAAKLTLSRPGRQISLTDMTEVDELGFGLDDDEATLKAGATMKAMLPPPKAKVKFPNTCDQDFDELEADLVLPLNLTNLTLATQSLSKFHSPVRLSSATEAWDSPGTSASERKLRGGTSSWDEHSPKRLSETSVTSISDNPSHIQDKSVDEKDDMEDGLVLPDPMFFSSANSRKLVAILDRKRKPQYQKMMETHENLRKGDESIEDGLVLVDPKMELTQGRLQSRVSARSKGKSEKEKAREKAREQGWGKAKPPLPPPTRERIENTSGSAGLKTHSATVAQRLEPSGEKPRASLETIATGHSSNLTTSATPSSSRLRHQRSGHFVPRSHSPFGSINKQSLASSNDALASLSPPSSPNQEAPGRYHHSPSRLTMPTVSSEARSRSRGIPFSQSSSSASSMSTSGSAGVIATPRSRHGGGVRVIDTPEMRYPGDGMDESIVNFAAERTESAAKRGLCSCSYSMVMPDLVHYV